MIPSPRALLLGFPPLAVLPVEWEGKKINLVDTPGYADFVSEVICGAQAADIRAVRRTFNFRYRSASHWIQIFRDFYGPTHKAFAALDPARQDSLAKDITALLDRCNTAGSASLVVPSEYLEAIITKR